MRRLLKNPLEPERIQEIITEAVDIEKSFICDSLPVSIAIQAQCLACQSMLYFAKCVRLYGAGLIALHGQYLS